MEPSNNKKKKVFDAKKKMQTMSKEQIRVTIDKKKECNARAMGIVEIMIEPYVDERWLIENLIYINQCHFQDAVEERAISKFCGYPLCDGPLKNIPNKHYHISTTQNKVFDITERKNYCSNSCYQAGVFLKNQLFTSPLWLRDCEDVVTYSLYSSAPTSGITGLEINLGNTNPAKLDVDEEIDRKILEEEKNRKIVKLAPNGVTKDNEKDISDSESDLFEDAEEEMKDISETLRSARIRSSLIEEEKNEEFFMSRTSYEDGECENTQSDLDTAKIIQRVSSIRINSSECVDSTTQRHDKRKSGSKCDGQMASKKIKPSLPIDLKIDLFIMEWFTVESLTYIYGEEAIKEKFQEFGSPLNEVNFNKMKDDYMYERFEEICRRLNILEIRDQDERELEPKKPLPDYNELKREAEQLELKVRNFYRGDIKVAFHVGNEKGERRRKESDGSAPPVLPLVDKHAIIAARRRIMLDKLNLTLPDILNALNLGQFCLRKEVQELVHTLSLSASNIMMKPPEWNLVALVLIRIMTIRNECLRISYFSDLPQRRIVNFLMTYNLDLNFLERQVLNINDIELIIRNSQ